VEVEAAVLPMEEEAVVNIEMKVEEVGQKVVEVGHTEKEEEQALMFQSSVRSQQQIAVHLFDNTFAVEDNSIPLSTDS
jgi:hypothetical protein